jgi:hypothetical protein
MGNLKKYVFGRSKGVLLNTFIGGVASTINTASLLATKLQISTSRITSFLAVGSDIECNISGSYEIPDNCFRETGNNIVYYDDRSGLVSILNSECFSGSLGTNTLQFVNFPNATSINQAFNFTNLLKKIEFPNCTSVLGSVFNNSNIEIAYFPRCNVLGSTSGNNNVFLNSTKLKTIYVNQFLQTNNNGQPDGDLSFAISQGIIVRYVTNFTVPNPVTNLSVGTIYNTAIQLNFTAPSSTNTIDYYECYSNGVFKNNITASGQYITGLIANTSYTITVIAVDVFYNKSVVSNSLVVSTSNVVYNDSDANAFNTNAGITIEAQKEAVNILVTDLKTAGIWNKLKVIYPMLGGTASQHKFNLKNPLNTDAAFRLSFNGSFIHSSNGVKGNGGYANTFFKNSDFNTYSNQSITAHITPQSVNIGDWHYGNINVTPNTRMTIEGTSLKYQNSSANLLSVGVSAPYNGVSIIQRISVSQVNVFFKGSKLITSSETQIANSNTNPFAIGSQFSNGSSNASFATFKFFSFGDSLTDSESIALTNIINFYQSFLNR